MIEVKFDSMTGIYTQTIVTVFRNFVCIVRCIAINFEWALWTMKLARGFFFFGLGQT